MKKKLVTFSILLVMLTFLSITSVLAQEEWLTNSQFYKVISPYFVPAGMNGLSGIIIGLVTMIIIMVIFIDILTLVTPFSRWVTWVIAVGLGIIAILFKFNVTVAAWGFSIGATIFSFAGTASVLLTVVLGILVMVFLFFGGNKLTTWFRKIRANREEIDRDFRVRKRGEQVNAAVEQSKAMIGESK